MNNELLIRTHLGDIKAFLQSGFYTSNNPTKHIHKHSYAEIHIIYGGNAEYRIGNKTYHVKNGYMLGIPKDCFHACVKKDKETQYIPFQIDLDIKSKKVVPLDPALVEAFLNETKKLCESGDHSRIAHFIALSLTALTDNMLEAPVITDYKFLIYEFFSSNYARDIKLKDLADILHLSERQTERLVLNYTGRSFKKELSFIRVTMAYQIVESYGASLTEAAEYVGYRSYTGFFKAMKKWKNNFK